MKRVFFCLIVLSVLLIAATGLAGTLQLPAGLTQIEEEAFRYDTSFDEVIIPGRVTTIGEYAFADTAVRLVRFPDSVTSIAGNAFYGLPQNSLYAVAVKDSYAWNWCWQHGVTLLPETMSLNAGAKVPGSDGERITISDALRENFAGWVYGPEGIDELTIEILQSGSDKTYRSFSVPVNDYCYNLIMLNFRSDLKLLPAGEYTIHMDVKTFAGDSIRVCDNSFSMALPDGVTPDRKLPGWFASSSSSPNTDLRNKSAALCDVSYYNESHAMDEVKKYGFMDLTAYHYTSGEHTCGVIFGWQNITDSEGKPKRLVLVLCRGTDSSPEWKSNFVIGTGTFHYGFQQAAKEVYRELTEEYLSGMYENGLSPEDFIIWTTGHSRGAAVSNLLAGHYLPKCFTASQVYCYTFATPNVVRSGNIARSNIHNYILGGDVVARVPLNAWGFGRYGTNHILHNGEIVAGYEVVDERTMSILCNAAAPYDSFTRFLAQVDTQGAGLSVLYSALLSGAVVDADAWAALSEAVNYTGDTHSRVTYRRVLEQGGGYWTGSYLRPDQSAGPANFTGSAKSASSVQLAWSPVSGDCWYEIRYGKAMTVGWSNSVMVHNVSSCIIDGLDQDTNYAFDISSLHDGVWSERSETIHVQTNPFTVRVTEVSPSRITLAWDDCGTSGAEYTVRKGLAYTTGWGDFCKPVTETSMVFNKLEPDTTYAFDVCYVTRQMKGGKYEEVCSTPSLERPSTHGFGLYGQAESVTSIRLQWNNVPDAKKYEIRYDKANTTTWTYTKSDIKGTSIIIDNLEPDTKYAFQIRAYIDGHYTDYSGTERISTSELLEPANFRYGNITNTTVELCWDNAAGADSYEIRYDKGGTTTWRWTKRTGGNSIVIHNLEPGTEYVFQIRSVAGNSFTSSWSGKIRPTTKSLNLRVKNITMNSATLEWDAATDFAKYEVRAGKTNTTTWSHCKRLSDTSVTFILDYDSNYAFDICVVMHEAQNANDQDILSSRSKITAKTLDFGVTGRVESATSVSLQWNSFLTATSYTVRYGPINTSTWLYKTVTATSTVITGLEPDTTYAFEVSANAASGASSDYGGRATFTTYKLLCPDNFRVTNEYSSSVRLAWNGVAQAQAYKIRYDKSGTTTWRYEKTVTGTNAVISGLDPETEYAFDICSVRENQCSSVSGTVYGTPTMRLRATSATPTRITVAWDAADGVSEYELRYAQSGPHSWNSVRVKNKTSYEITDLKPDTEYAFDICTVKNGNTTARSKTIYKRTTVLATPGNIQATNITISSMKISWDPVPGVSGYNIRFAKANTSGWDIEETVTGTSRTFTNLLPDTKYAFDICSTVDGKTSSLSGTYRPKTLALSVPENIHVTYNSKGKITLAWNAVPGVEGYKIAYGKKNTAGWDYKTTASTSVTLSGLTSGKTYIIQIYAYYKSESSSWSGRLPVDVN